MPIPGECDSCGRKVQAPDNMAGKRVRCKQCGNIFQLPGGEEPAEANDLDALAEIERSFGAIENPPRPTRPTPRSADADDDQSESSQTDEEEEYEAAVYAGRTNVRYRFAYAREIDAYLPYVLSIGALVWLAVSCFKLDQTSVVWMPFVRLAIALAAYSLFVAPLTLVLIRKAGRKMRFQMPVNDRWRAFASYVPGFAMAYAMWALANGDWVALVLGSLAGITIATGAMALLFRLYPLEIAPAGAYGGAGFFSGMALAGIIFWGINSLLVQVAVSTKNPDMLPASLFGPGFSWVSQADRDRIMAELHPAPKPRPQSSTTVAPVIPPPQPDNTAAANPASVLSSIKVAPIPVGFDEMIMPAGRSPYVAVIRPSGTGLSVEPWSTEDWKPKSVAYFAKSSAQRENHYILSPDGDLVAHISSFPRTSVQVWSFSENRTRLIYLDTKYGEQPEAIAFLGGQLVLVRSTQGSTGYLQAFDTVSGKEAYPAIEVPSYDAGTRNTTLALSRDGSMAAAVGKIDNKPTLGIYNLHTGKPICSMEIAALDPRMFVTPTGMNFSFSGDQLAMLFVVANNGLVLNYRIDPAANQVTEEAEHVYPAGPLPGQDVSRFTGNALSWLPNDRGWLMYGTGIFSIKDGLLVDKVPTITGIESCRVMQPDMVECVNRNAGNQKQFAIVNLNMTRIMALMGDLPIDAAPTSAPAATAPAAPAAPAAP